MKDYRLEPPAYKAPPPCPVCGSEMYGMIYIGLDNEAVGCDNCLSLYSPEEWQDKLDCEGIYHVGYTEDQMVYDK